MEDLQATITDAEKVAVAELAHPTPPPPLNEPESLREEVNEDFRGHNQWKHALTAGANLFM